MDSELDTAFLLVWVILCSFSWSSSTNCSWHVAHVGTGHNPMCLLNEVTSRRTLWHLGHLNRMDLQMDWCCLKLSFLLNDLPQSPQVCTSCRLCLVLTCLVRFLLLLNFRPHSVQYTCLEVILDVVKHHRRMNVWLWLRCIYSYLHRKCICYFISHILFLE